MINHNRKTRLPMPLRIAGVLAFCAAASMAQGSSIEEKIRKQMEEISQLMRESERLLLEISKSGKLAERQADIVRKLKELQNKQPPDAAASAAQKEQAEKERKKREQLQQQQQQLERKLSDLLNNQKSSSQMTVSRLVQLLANLPRQKGGQGPGDKHQKPKKRRPDKKDDQVRKDKQPNKPRREEDRRKRMERQRKEKERLDRARMSHIEAWIAHLPPEVQERINRNDLRNIPPLYRELVRKYTTRRAKREAEEDRK